MIPGRPHGPLWTGLAMVALAAAYFATGLGSLHLFAVFHPTASTLWPSTGIAIAALLLWGRRLWPGVATGAFLVYFVNTSQLSLSLLIALGSTLEALLAATLVRATVRAGGFFDGLRNTGLFMVLAGLFAPAVAASIGVLALFLLGHVPATTSTGLLILTWWLGGVVGALLVGPMILLWATQWRSGWRSGSRTERVAATLAAPVAAAILFNLERVFSVTPNLPLAFLVVPAVLWVAYRFGPRDASTSTALVAVVATVTTLAGHGPFGGFPAATTFPLLLAFLVVLAATSLALGALAVERRRAEEGLELRVRERTERLEKTLEDLRRSQSRLAEAQSTARLGSWEWDLVNDRIHWSEEMYRILGLDSQGFTPTFTSYAERVHPADRAEFEAGAQEALEQKNPFTVPEHRIVRPDGEWRWVRGEGAVEVDDAGNAVRLYGTSQDITDRRRAEIQFKAIVQSAPDAIFTADEAGNITMANAQAEKLFGYTHEELLNLRVEALVPERFRPRHAHHRATYHEDPKIRPMGTGLDLRARRKDGSEFPVEISLSPLETEAGTQVAAIVRDVTERQKVAEADRIAFARLVEIEKLKEMDRFKTQVLNTASHELNTPITPLKLQIHLLQNVLGDLSKEQQHAVNVLDRNVDRLASLVSDILDVARLQANTLKLTPGPTEIGTLAREAVETFEAPAEEDEISLALACEGDLALQADSRRISQVLYNLISNAVKFSPPGRTVQVRCRNTGESLRVEVQDDGPGLDPEQIEQLFQPFSQVHERTPDSPSGTGLGLYICKGIVEQHGGQIGVNSKGAGHGATFWFTIPRTIAMDAQDGADGGGPSDASSPDGPSDEPASPGPGEDAERPSG